MNNNYLTGTPYSEIKNSIHLSQEFLLFRFFDMGFVAACANNCCILPSVVKTYTIKRKDVSPSEKYDLDRETFNSNFKNNLSVAKRLKKYTENRRNLLDLIRKVYPDFCLNMETKVSEEDFALYNQSKTALRRLILHPIEADPLLFHSDFLQTYIDNLDAVIDTQDFSKACDIEDHFMLSELDKFLSMLNHLPEEEQQNFRRNTFPVEDNQISALSLISRIQADRRTRIEKYKSIQTLYNKLDSKSYINIDGSQPEDR